MSTSYAFLLKYYETFAEAAPGAYQLSWVGMGCLRQSERAAGVSQMKVPMPLQHIDQGWQKWYGPFARDLIGRLPGEKQDMFMDHPGFLKGLRKSGRDERLPR